MASVSVDASRLAGSEFKRVRPSKANSSFAILTLEPCACCKSCNHASKLHKLQALRCKPCETA